RWGLHDGDKTGALVVSAALAEAPLYRLPRHLIAVAPPESACIFNDRVVSITRFFLWGEPLVAPAAYLQKWRQRWKQ
ncbi:MAG: hypothetical protein WCN95_04025, partial [bacterium]